MTSEKNFLKRHSSGCVLLFRLVDLACVTLAGALSYGWVTVGQAADVPLGRSLLLVMITSALVFDYFELYRPWRGERLRNELRLVAGAWATAWAASATIGLLLGVDVASEANHHWLVLWAVVGLMLLVTSRVALRKSLAWFRARGFNLRRVAVLGMSRVGLAAARNINELPWTGYRIVGFVDDREDPRMDTGGLARLGGIEQVGELVQEKELDEVWIGFPFRGESRVKEALHRLRHTPTTIRLLVDVYAFEMMSHSASQIAGVPVINIHASPLDEGANRLIKAFEDKALATLVLLVLGPLMVLIAAGVKLSSPGPVFYRQERISWNNRPFTMLKFRSMPVNAEDASGPVWAKPDEHRATGLGAFLRKTSLDELPQFINVLNGDMSIVGPRPERPHFVESFKDEVPLYMKKHMVKAGITGWAQVNGWRGQTDLRKRIEYDLYYIQNWSLALDVKIFLQTVVNGFVHKNAY